MDRVIGRSYAGGRDMRLRFTLNRGRTVLQTRSYSDWTQFFTTEEMNVLERGGSIERSQWIAELEEAQSDNKLNATR